MLVCPTYDPTTTELSKTEPTLCSFSSCCLPIVTSSRTWPREEVANWSIPCLCLCVCVRLCSCIFQPLKFPIRSQSIFTRSWNFCAKGLMRAKDWSQQSHIFSWIVCLLIQSICTTYIKTTTANPHNIHKTISLQWHNMTKWCKIHFRYQLFLVSGNSHWNITEKIWAYVITHLDKSAWHNDV